MLLVPESGSDVVVVVVEVVVGGRGRGLLIFPELELSPLPFPFTRFPSTSSLPLEIALPLFWFPELLIMNGDNRGGSDLLFLLITFPCTK